MIKKRKTILCNFVVFTLAAFCLPHNVESNDKLIVNNALGESVFKVEDIGRVHISELLDLTTNMSRIRQMRTDGRMQEIFNIDNNNDMILNRSTLVANNYVSGAVVGIQGRYFDIRAREGNSMVYLMRVQPNGNVGIGTTTPTHRLHLSGGAYSDGATWVNASSRELKENIKEVSVEEAVATLEKLTPVQYNYKADMKEQHVGFIAEDVPDMVATKDRKGLSPMDVTAILTKVVQEQQKMLVELQGQIAELKTELQLKKDKRLAFSQVTNHE